ncbi:MAG TPA: AMP-binding protein [Burkholderiaceae bacterium]|nr:AMP-binding protein [Burkholderiaceae bacterium]
MSDVPPSETEYLARLHELWRRAWPAGTPTGPTWPHGEIPLTEYLRIWARRQPDKPAVIYYGHTLTYAQLDEASDRMAALLAAHGVARGDRVAVFLPNSPQFVIVFYGILKLGAVHVPVSPMSRAFELEYELNDTGAVAIVAQDQLMPLVREVRAAGQQTVRAVFVTSLADVLPPELLEPPEPLEPAQRRRQSPQPQPQQQRRQPLLPLHESLRAARIPCDDGIDLLPALAALPAPLPLPPAGLDDIAALNYTGGTTGMPKGCVHTQRDMVYTAAANHGIALKLTPDSVLLSFFPQFWIAGENAGLIMPFFGGATLVLLARWDPPGVLAAIDRCKVTTMVLPVDGAVELMDHPRFGEFDLSSLKQVRVVSFVKKLNLEYRRRWFALTGTTLAESSWGMTETHTSDTFTTGFQQDDFDLHAQPIFVGLPVPGTEFKICDFDTGELKPLGVEGEIRVRTPSLLKAYWNRPEATAEALVDGWLRTGDIGVLDEDGFLHYLGRRKEMLKVKGMSVFPPEIEAVLGQHPAVIGSGVIGRPDPARGEVPVAFVVLRPGATATADDLAAWCRSRLAAYKQPELRIVDQLPMTATGKVKKQDLQP